MDEDNFPQVIQELLQNGKEENLARIKMEMNTALVEEAKERVEFEIRLHQRWKKALDLFETIFLLGRDSGTEFNKQVRPYAAKQQDFVFEVLTRIHARACQTMSAILSLLKSGHAMDTLARARTLHELDVTAQFIKNGGKDLAEKYLLYQVVDTLKAARGYEQHYKRLELEPPDPANIPALEAEVKRYRTKFGDQFSKFITGGRYGWACEALKNRQPTFEHIEKAVELDHLRPYYQMASYPVHTGPKGIMFELGSIGSQKVLPAGPSNAGLTLPATMALVSFSRCTTYLLCYHKYSGENNLTEILIKSVIASQVLQDLVNDAKEVFLETEQQLIQEELERQASDKK